MYEQFYGLKERPFSLNPDPFYLYMSAKHKKALNLMEYGLINQAAFSVISGEIGTGKTTLVRQLLHQIDKKFTIGLLTSTHHSFGELLKLILIAFSLDHRSKDKAELYQTLYDFLIEEYSRHHQVVLIIDEAQNMAPDTLEELRMLSNINVEEHNVLQMILVGQEGLRDMLRRADLEQFAQRIAVDFHLEPLDREDTHSYILHRLQVAGGPGSRHAFSMDACDAVYRYTGGTPRLINMLCDVALVYGFAEQQRTITAELIYEVALDKKGGGILPLREIAGPFEGEESDRIIRLHTHLVEKAENDCDQAVNHSEDNRLNESVEEETGPPKSISGPGRVSQAPTEDSEQTMEVEKRRTLHTLFQSMRLTLVCRRFLTRISKNSASVYTDAIRGKCKPILRKIHVWTHHLRSRGKAWSLAATQFLREYAYVRTFRNLKRVKGFKLSAIEQDKWLRSIRGKCRTWHSSLRPLSSAYGSKAIIVVAAVSVVGVLVLLDKAEVIQGHDALNASTEGVEALPHLAASTDTLLDSHQSTAKELGQADAKEELIDDVSISPLVLIPDVEPRQYTNTQISAQRENMVVVEAGSNLSTILMKELGRYDDLLLDEVLRLNPDIRNPDVIKIGQIITLPKFHIN